MPLVSVPPGAKPGDTVQYDIEGQRMNVVVPDGLAAGDTFSIATPGIPTVQAQALPSAPPQTVFGQVNAPQFTDEEKLCYALSYSVKCYAILDTFITLINILFSYYWWVMLFLLTGPLCGWIGADHFKPGYIQYYMFICILWACFALFLFAFLIYLYETGKWHRYIRHDNRITPGYVLFSAIIQLLWFFVRLMILQIVSKFHTVLAKVGHRRMVEVLEQGRPRAVMVYY
mmetsp:Transcript_22267/g.68730  ORF Transcript_22267/g.68730 Transcript_22267/m.68730 type:complete len:229 (-) Transcript_22267:180-866(-)